MSDGRAVLVTGAAGFVGRRICQALIAEGWRVTGLDRAPATGLDGLAAFWTRDLLDDAATEPTRFAAVVHLAGLLPGANRRDLFAINVGATSEVLERFVHPDCHFLLFSTGLVYGQQPAPFTEDQDCRPLDPYGQSKLGAEAVARAWGQAIGAVTTVLRPSVIYGTGAPEKMLLVSLMAALKKGEPFAMTAGEQRRDFVHVDDVASAVTAVLGRRAGGIFNVASGETITVRAAAELGARLAGHPELLRVGALPYRPNEVFDYRLATQALHDATGWQSRVTLAEGLRRLWEGIA